MADRINAKLLRASSRHFHQAIDTENANANDRNRKYGENMGKYDIHEGEESYHSENPN